MQGQDALTQFLEPQLEGSRLNVGIVVARFNEYAGQGMLEVAINELVRLGVERHRIWVRTVPGALEVPLALRTMAMTCPVDTMIALGAVIRGETYHFELVSNESARGIMQVSLDQDIPIANGVLTTENDEQTQVRIEQKALDCARCAVEMGNMMLDSDALLDQLDAAAEES